MTNETKDAILGRVFREKRDAERELALLCSEALRLSEVFRALSDGLRQSPEYVIFQGEPYDTVLGPVVQHLFKDADLDAAAIRKTVTDIKSAIRRLEDKKKELERLTTL